MESVDHSGMLQVRLCKSSSLRRWRLSEFELQLDMLDLITDWILD